MCIIGVHAGLCLHICMGVYMCICACVCVLLVWVCVCACVFLSVCVCLFVYSFVHGDMCECVYMRLCACVFVHICVFMCVVLCVVCVCNCVLQHQNFARSLMFCINHQASVYHTGSHGNCANKRYQLYDDLTNIGYQSE